jgi:type II secretory pathway component GspD/PulD (secretin)
VIGSRALLLDDGWKGQLEWLERDGLRRRAHRPDLVTGQRADGRLLPVEVELSSKSVKRLRAILGLHAAWIAAGRTSATIYVCGPSELAERVQREAAAFGLAGEHKTLRVELLATVIAAARATRLTAQPSEATLMSGGVA